MQTPTQQFSLGFAPVAKAAIPPSEVAGDDEPVAGMGFDYHLGLVADFSPGIPETALNMSMFAETRGTPKGIEIYHPIRQNAGPPKCEHNELVAGSDSRRQRRENQCRRSRERSRTQRLRAP